MTVFIGINYKMYQIVGDKAFAKYEEAKGNNVTSAGYNRVRNKVLSTFYKKYEAKVKELVGKHIEERFPMLSGMDFDVNITEDFFNDMPAVHIVSEQWSEYLSNAGYEKLQDILYSFLHNTTIYVNGNREWKSWEEENAKEMMEEIKHWNL